MESIFKLRREYLSFLQQKTQGMFIPSQVTLETWSDKIAKGNVLQTVGTIPWAFEVLNDTEFLLPQYKMI